MIICELRLSPTEQLASLIGVCMLIAVDYTLSALRFKDLSFSECLYYTFGYKAGGIVCYFDVISFSETVNYFSKAPGAGLRVAAGKRVHST